MNIIIRQLYIFSKLFFFIQQMAAQDCTAAFTVGETDLTIQFTDQSTSLPGDPIVNWFWDFDDGSTSTQQNPVHTFGDPNDKYDVILTITTQNGCTAEVEIRIEICVLTLNVNVGSCDANGNIPLTINVSDVYDNAKDINISIDGNLIPGSPFGIQSDEPVTVNTTIIGDGLQHVLTVQSDDIGTCNNSFTFSVPDCNSNCFLSAFQVGFAGGTTHTINVGTGGNNVFTPNQTTISVGDLVNFQFVDNGHTTTSDANSGIDAWNSGELGVGSTYPVTIQNPGVHPFYCIPHGGPGGSGMSGTIIANCPAGNNFSLEINFNTTQANPGGFNVQIDGVNQPSSPFSYNGTGAQTVTIPISGDGAAHTIEVIDVDDPTCVLSNNFTAPDCGAAPSCNLSLTTSQTGGCDANNNVNIEVIVTSINGGTAGFNLTVDGTNIAGSPFLYDGSGTTTINIDVIGDGQNHTITATDVNDGSCTGTTNIATANCTIPCSLTNLSATAGANTTQVVLVEDFVFNPQNITISAGDIIEWQWVGAIDHTSTSDATGGADAWDSGLLGTGATYQSPVLSAGVHPYYCIPHGAPGGVGMAGTITVQANCTDGMVAFNLTFNATGGGFDGFDVTVDGIFNSNHAYDASGNNSVSIFVPGDGQNHTIEIQDSNDPNCTISTNITTPDCNAPTCQLTASATENGGCDANDNVPVDVTVNDVGGSTNGFTVNVDGQNIGSFSYSGNGTTTISIDIIGDGQSHNIEIIDADDANCNAATSVTTTNCVIPCNFSNLSLTAVSGDNPSTHSVEVKDFEFVPQDISITAGDVINFQWTGAIAHTATSDSPTQPDAFDSGLLNQGNNFQVTITNEGVHPYYCIPHGAHGGVGMAGTINATPPLPPCDANGQVLVSVGFQSVGNGANGFIVLVDGQQIGGITPYAQGGMNATVLNIDGDGQSHSIEIQDVDNANCGISGTITTSDCNTPMPCDLTLFASQISDCDSNDQVNVELEIISHNEGASGFNIFVDGNTYEGSPYFYDASDTTILNIILDGNGLTQTIEIVDLDSTNCSTILPIETPPCFDFCQILNLTTSTNMASKHFVEVKEFEFFPANLDILIGDTVQFFWTGAIAHTATSDAISGANSWDSGLLSAGATFEVVITQAGAHPYYCIPHGGPGGIGQSGMINALEPCMDSMALITVNFDAHLGSNQGYQVFLDGNLIAGPLPYDDPNGENSTLVTVPTDGQNHLLTVGDLETVFCAATIQFTTPDCNPEICEIANLSVEFPEPTTHLVEVLDFEFSPKDLTINLGDTVRYVWIGAIPHTATSDATTGEDVWNSGLVGQGAIFDLVIDNTGFHPYYCIPHGGPGGIGMAGTITVEDNNCQNGLVTAQLNFQNEAGNSGSFNVLIDGNLSGNSPLNYDNSGINDLLISLPGDGNEHTIIVADFTNENCADTITVVTENCDLTCSLSANFTQTADCDVNEDLLYEITIENENSGSGFSLNVDGNGATNFNYDPSGTTVLEINLPGDNAVHEIVIQDLDSINCNLILEIMTPDCTPQAAKSI